MAAITPSNPHGLGGVESPGVVVKAADPPGPGEWGCFWLIVATQVLGLGLFIWDIFRR